MNSAWRTAAGTAAGWPAVVSPPVHLALLSTLLLLTGWLTLPVWQMVHVEGFSASIQSLALHWSEGSLRPYDTLFPFNLEFFATSRAGAVLVLSAVYRVFPDAGDAAFAAVMVFGAVLLAGSSVLLLRRWVGATWPWAVLALLLLPGISESVFFYNDNVLSSGLATAGLAALWWRKEAAFGLWQPGLAGLLLGAAAVVRADAIVLVPAALLSVGLQRGGWRAVALRAGVVCLAAAAVIAAALPPLGIDFFDTLDTARQAVALWNRPARALDHLRTLTLFIGLPGTAAAAIGLVVLTVRRRWGLLLLLAGPPVLFNLVYIGKAWEVRALLPTAVFCAALAVVGLQWLWRGAPRWALAGATAAVLALALAPPAPVFLRDGPRSISGRFWAPVLWSGWQAVSRETFATIGRASADVGPGAVIATHYWDEDRYMHLTLQQQGWRLAQTPGSDCGGTVETFVRGTARIQHLRLHTPMVGGWEKAIPDRWDRYLQTCGPLPDGVPLRLISAPGLFPALGPVDAAFAADPGWVPGTVSTRFPRWPRVPLRVADIGPPMRDGFAALLAAETARLPASPPKPTAADIAPVLRRQLHLP